MTYNLTRIWRHIVRAIQWYLQRYKVQREKKNARVTSRPQTVEACNDFLQGNLELYGVQKNVNIHGWVLACVYVEECRFVYGCAIPSVTYRREYFHGRCFITSSAGEITKRADRRGKHVFSLPTCCTKAIPRSGNTYTRGFSIVRVKIESTTVSRSFRCYAMFISYFTRYFALTNMICYYVFHCVRFYKVIKKMFDFSNTIISLLKKKMVSVLYYT